MRHGVEVLYLNKYMSEMNETWHVLRKGSVIDKNWHDVIMTSPGVICQPLKFAIFEGLHLREYRFDWNETWYVLRQGSVIDKNWHDVIMTSLFEFLGIFHFFGKCTFFCI